MFKNNKSHRIHISDIFLDSRTKPTPAPTPTLKTQSAPSAGKKVSKGFIAALLVICTSAVAAFFVSKNNTGEKAVGAEKAVAAASKSATTEGVNNREIFIEDLRRKSKQLEEKQKIEKEENNLNHTTSIKTNGHITTSPKNSSKSEDRELMVLQYKVASKAFFYSQPDKNAKENKSIVWKKSYTPFNALAEENGFIYAVISDNSGRDMEGWLRKQDLQQVKTVMYESDLK